ncbi:MAG: restriction endonuclease subunit S [Mycobacterium sp.]
MKTKPLEQLIRPAGDRAGSEDSYPVYSVTKHDGFVPSAEYFKKQVYSRDLANYRRVRPGDFAYATIHLDEGSIGIAPTDGLISPMYTVFRPELHLVDPAYLLRYLKSPVALAQYPRFGRGSVHRRKSISLAALGKLPVPLPSLVEQRRVAAILGHASELRIRRREATNQMDSLASSIFYDMFGDPLLNPKGWRVCRFEDVVDTMRYGPRFYNESYSPGGVKIVRITDLDQHGHLDFNSMPRMDVSDGEFKKSCLTPGDIIFARTGATVGKLAVIRDGDPACIAGAYFIRIRLKDAAEPDYIAAALRSRSIQSIIVSGSHQSAQQNFSGPGLRALVLPIPPIDLQRQFSSALTMLVERIAPIARSASELDQLFDSLQWRAFKGQL